MRLEQSWAVACAAVLISCVGGGGGSDGSAVTVASACSDFCEVRATCGGDRPDCKADCEADVPSTCAARVASTTRCMRGLPMSELCERDTPAPECADAFAAMVDCIQGGDGAPLPASPDLGDSCFPTNACSPELECIDYDVTGMTCTLACDNNSECPENGLCLLFDGDEGHVCVRGCETNADCEGTPAGTCVVGGEQLLGRKFCE